jgi:hypothetical protein
MLQVKGVRSQQLKNEHSARAVLLRTCLPFEEALPMLSRCAAVGKGAAWHHARVKQIIAGVKMCSSDCTRL